MPPYVYQPRDDDTASLAVASLPPITDGSRWASLLHIQRPVPGFVEVWSRDTTMIARYTRTSNAAVWIDRKQIGASGAVLFPVQAGAVVIEAQGNGGADSFGPGGAFDPVGGWLLGDGATSATSIVFARWTPFRPVDVEPVCVATNTVADTDQTFGPEPIDAGGSTEFRPPRFLRRAIVRTAGPATITIASGPAKLDTSITAINGGPLVVECGPWDVIRVTNPGAAVLQCSVTWLPTAGSN